MNEFSQLATTTHQNVVQGGALSLRSRLQIGSALVGAAMALTNPALALGGPECGPAVAGVVTCTGAHAAGMTYGAAGQDDLTINIDSAATVTSTVAGDHGVFASSWQGDLTINQSGGVSTTGDAAHGIRGDAWSGGTASVTNTGAVTTSGADALGIVATAGDGDRTVTNSGDVTTTGINSHGVLANSQNGEVTVINTTDGVLSTASANSSGITASSIIGNVRLENHGSVTTAGPNSTAIIGIARDGDLSLTSTGSITTNGASGGVILQSFGGDITAVVGSISSNGVNNLAIGIHNFSTGGVDLTTSGTISASGAGNRGITAASNGGSVRIANNADITADDLGISAWAATTLDITNSGAISTIEGNAYAIEGISTVGAVSIANTGATTTAGDFASGIKAANETGAITVDNKGSISTLGFMALGVQAKALGGDITLTNAAGGVITTTGDMASGLQAETESGAVTLGNKGSISTGGEQAMGLEAKTLSGDIVLTNAAGGVITTSGIHGIGLKAHSTTGPISIDNQGVITTTGDNGHGIHATTNNSDRALAERGDVTLISRGPISTSGINALGVLVQTEAGDIAADISSVSTTGDDSGAVHLWTTSGDITLTTSGVLATAGVVSDAILVRTASGTIMVNNAAAVTTSGDNSTALYAEAGAGSINIVSTGSVSTSGVNSYGIVAQGEGDVTITADAVTTTGDRSRGLSASTYNGVARIVAHGPITTAGDGVIGSTALGAVDILTRGAVSTTGELGIGVRAGSDSGDINIVTEGTVTTAGLESTAIVVESNTGKVSIVAKGALLTTGDNGDGVAAYSAGDVNITTAAITTTGYSADAIRARSEDGTARILVQGLISTRDDNSDGVDVNSYAGDVDVTVGSISTKGAYSSGVEADSDDGVVRVVSTGAITTEGEESYGIDANGGGGVFIDANAISTLGVNAHGVLARSTSSTTSVKVNRVSATGQGSHGIDLSSEVGDILVTAGVVRADNTAIRVLNGEGDITISTTGAVTSATAGAIQANSIDGVVVLNIGAASVLTSGVPSFGPAAFGPSKAMTGGVSTVLAEGQTVTINNAGTINQGEWTTISAKGEVTLNNTGLITGNVEFGGGDDIINNKGRFVLSGLSDFGGGDDRFINTGLVMMKGNATLAHLERFVNAGTINLADGRVGDVLTISGDYVGQDGRLVLDMDAGATGGPAYDQLVVGGSATGTTTITLNYKNAAKLQPGAVLKLVDAAGGSAAGAFTLAAETTNIGFARYGVRHDVAADDFFIAVTEGAAVFRSLKLNEGAQSLWRQSADAWSAHTAALRDPADAASTGRVWGQVYGGSDKRDETLIRADQTVDLSYTQDHVGGQMGFDLGVIGATGMTYGLTGGYVDSRLEFRDKADSADYKSFNLGAYAGVQRGRYFANALAKYDLIDIQARSTTAGYDEDLDGHGYGLQVETGARFNGQMETKAFFFEPVVSLAYSRTALDALSAQGAVIDFEALNGLRAKAGARLGGGTSIAQGQIAYYLGAHLVQELAGEDGVRFTSGSAHSAFDNNAVDAYGQYQLGVTFTSNAGVTGFVEAKADDGDDYRNYTGRIGVRVSF